MVTQNHRAYYDSMAQDLGGKLPCRDRSVVSDIASTDSPQFKTQNKKNNKTRPLDCRLPVTGK